MAYDYIKSISGDFPAGNCVPGLLKFQIDAHVGITTVMNYVKNVGDNCTMNFATEPSAPEKATIDSIILLHDSVEIALWFKVAAFSPHEPVSDVDASIIVADFSALLSPGSVAWRVDHGELQVYNGSDFIHMDGSAIHKDVAGEISSLDEKTTPHDDDLILVEDSESTGPVNQKKRVKVSSLGGGAGPPKHSTQILTFDATQDWDVANGTMATLTLTADCTFDAPSNPEAGGEYVLILNTATYDVTSWASVFKWVGGSAPVLPASSKVVIFFLYDGTDLMGVMNGGFA